MLTCSLLAAFLILVIPISDIWTTRWLKRSTDPAKKVKAYAGTSVLLWLASVVVWRTVRPGFLYATRPEDAVKGLVGNCVVSGFAVGLIAMLMIQALIIRSKPKLVAAAQKQMKKLDFFLPYTSREQAWFAVVSVTAGICEETLYRGFLYHYFRDFWHWGLLLAVVASAVVFGLAHGYQGVSGIVATGAIGGLMAALYLATGSLLAPMIFHALLDLRILIFPVPVPSSDAFFAPGG
jgi:CAAX protease family protein